MKMVKVKRFLKKALNPNTPCGCCGSPVPPEYALCFVCLSDTQRFQLDRRNKQIEELEAKLDTAAETQPTWKHLCYAELLEQLLETLKCDWAPREEDTAWEIIDQIEATLQRAGELPEKWRKNIDEWDEGSANVKLAADCADELQAVLEGSDEQND